jgi:hypothetical protein
MGIQQWQQLDPVMEDIYEVPKSLAKTKIGLSKPCNRRKKIEVIFVVDEKIIHGDKLILIKRSPVFELMFEYGWGANPNIPIKIINTSAKDFTTFIDYIHRDKLNVSMNNVFGLLKLGKVFFLYNPQKKLQ